MAPNGESSFLKNIRADLPASVVVFLVALPLCLGIALASGAPLLAGVIAGVVGGLIVGGLSGSAIGVSGPAAGLAVIVLSAIEELGAFDIFLVAVILAGIIQIFLGFIRSGIVAYYFPSSVITGMLAGIGIVIFLKQIPHALGFDRDPEGDLAFSQTDGENTLSELSAAVDFVSMGPLTISVVSLVILVLWESSWLKRTKWLALVPGPLVAVLAGVGLALAFRSSPVLALGPEELVKMPLVTGIADIAGLLTLPDFSALGIAAVYKTAVVIAVVASLETLLCVEATDKLDPAKRVTPANRELKAQGVGNVVSGLLGGLPVTQVIVRSSANLGAGGRTKLSAILHGMLLLVSAIALPSIINLIPLATLAAILLVVGFKLAKPTLFARMFRSGVQQFVPFAVTIVGIVFVDLLVGVGIGLAAAIVGLLFENYQLPFQVQPSSGSPSGSLRFVLAQQVSFLNKASILQCLKSVPNNASVEIDATDSVYVHRDVVEIIDDFVIGAKSRNITVVVKGLEHHQKGHPSGGTSITVTPTNTRSETPQP